MLYQYHHSTLADFPDHNIKAVFKDFLSSKPGRAAKTAPGILLQIIRLNEYESSNGGLEPVTRERVYKAAGIKQKDMSYAYDLIRVLENDGWISVAEVAGTNVMKDRLALKTFANQTLIHLCFVNQAHNKDGKGIFPTA